MKNQPVCTFLLLPILSLTMLFFAPTDVLSQIPRNILYQGTLTDNNGNLVPDGTYFIRLRIWSDSISNDISFEKWNSNIQAFEIAGGILESHLGAQPMPPLPNGVFENDTNLFLGMTIGTSPELRPRIKFAAVPYAYKALVADTSAVAMSLTPNAVTGINVVDGSLSLVELSQSGANSGDIIKWNGSQWSPSSDSGSNGDITGISVGTGLAGGGDSGSVFIYIPPDGILSIHLATNSVGGTELAPNSVGTTHIAPGSVGTSDLAPSSVGTSEIIDNSIFGVDVVDEPGLAQNRSADTINLDNLVMVDLAVVSITIPASGFIFLSGRANFRMYGAISNNLAYLQIDQNQGGTEIGGSFSVAGFSSYPTSGDHFFTGNCQRTYFKSAGTHTFRLEARKITSSAQSFCEAFSPILTALYLPTSYGPVTLTGEQPPANPAEK